jgi:hypothetical protein
LWKTGKLVCYNAAMRRLSAYLICITLAGCQGGVGGKRVGSAVGGAAGSVVGYQYGQTGIGRSVGSSLGGVAGEAADARQRAPAPAAPAPAAASAPAKFCPIGGERYPESITYCPLHGSALRSMEGHDAQGGKP